MKKLEYGFARDFVAQHKDYIQQELEKLRTIKSIWNELKDHSKEKFRTGYLRIKYLIKSPEIYLCNTI